MAQNHVLSNVSCCVGRSENLTCSSEALEMRMRKLVLDLSVAQILPEKISKMFLRKKLGFIDMLSTVDHFKQIFFAFFFWHKGKLKPNIIYFSRKKISHF